MKAHRPHPRLFPILVAGVMVCMMSSFAHSQDEPVVIGLQQKLPTFGYTPPRGAFTILGQYSQDSSSGGTSGNTETSELRFEERISLDTSAYIVHPNFLNIPLYGEFGLIQERFDVDGRSDRSNTTLYLWNVRAEFLKEQPYNLALYSDRSENIVDRAFDQSFRNMYTTYGAVLTGRHKIFPSTLRVYREEQAQETLGGAEDFTLNNNVLEWHTEVLMGPNQTLTWDYRFNQTDQSSASGVSDESTGQSAAIGHVIGFGPAAAYTLNSNLIYTDVTGDFANERLHLDELLRLRHSRTLETEYQYIFDQQETLTLDRTMNRATAKVRHKLYESLHTNVLGGFLQLDTGDDAQTQDIFGNLDFQYNKKVPLGELIGSLDLGYTTRDSSQGGSAIQVIDQPFVFIGFEPIIIPGQTVDPNSIVISNTIGQLFVEGIDYTVTDRPDGVRIDRIIGGAIPADSTVLIDYVILPAPDTRIDTAAAGLSLRYDIHEGPLKGLSPYIRLAAIEQDVSGGGGLIEAESVRGYLVGADYRFWSLILTGEYEVYDSSLVPYNATRFIARLNHRISGDTILTGYGSYIRTDYTDTNELNTTINGTVSASHLLTPNLMISAGLSFVDLDNSQGGHTQGLQEMLDIRWRNRQVEVFAKLRNANRWTDDEDVSFQFFEVGLRREF